MTRGSRDTHPDSASTRSNACANGARRAASGRVGLAVEACLAAEPARESTQRQLIEIYLSEGNRADALRQYASYRRVIRDEVGVEPSREITDLVRAGAIVGGGRNQAR